MGIWLPPCTEGGLKRVWNLRSKRRQKRITGGRTVFSAYFHVAYIWNYIIHFCCIISDSISAGKGKGIPQDKKQTASMPVIGPGKVFETDFLSIQLLIAV
jgi:hypothetical protein